MSREIKFRAIHRLTKFKWYEEDLIFHDGKWYEHWRAFEDGRPLNMKTCEVMQYTGNLDKHGNEIYEDDLLSDEYGRVYRVVFKGDCWRCEPNPFKGRKNRWISNDLEVIGNVYEHPELLEEDAE